VSDGAIPALVMHWVHVLHRHPGFLVLIWVKAVARYAF
jgi:hypothetical protein